MILEKETFQKFGYRIETLSYGSAKRIIGECDGCGKIREMRFCDYRDLCLQCATKTDDYRKKMSDAMHGDNHANVSLEKNPNWQGGISSKSRDFSITVGFRECVREFYERRCFLCGLSEETEMHNARINNKRIHKISVHILNNQKSPIETEEKFIVLCDNCGNSFKKYRIFWGNIFRKYINEELNGKCYLTREEMKIRFPQKKKTPEENKAKRKEYYQKHKKHINECNKKYNQKHSQKYYQEHREIRIEYAQSYYHTDKGKEVKLKSIAKRKRKLGFVPLNDPFENSDGHHLDKEFVLYIPTELHRSISHNVFTGKNMEKINILAIEFAYGIDSEQNDANHLKSIENKKHSLSSSNFKESN